MKYLSIITVTILFSTLNFYSTIEIEKHNSSVELSSPLSEIVVDTSINPQSYLDAVSINTRFEGPKRPSWFTDVSYKLNNISKELNELENYASSFETKVVKLETINKDEDEEIDLIEATFDQLQVRTTITSKAKNTIHTDKQVTIEPDYWTTLYSVETKQGLLLYRPKNRVKNCSITSSPCGHHQLSVQALKDIGCKSNQCKKDREDFAKSLSMSKQLQAINDKRLKKAGISNLPEYQQYLVHQQGASGLKKLIAAHKGQKKLSNRMKKNMANNSPYSYKKLKRLSSKQAANKFMQHWKQKWEDEKDLIKVSQLDLKTLPIFNEHELNIALNLNLRY